MATTSLGQSTVNFRNTGPFLTDADRFVRDSAGNLLATPDYLAQLYYGAPGSLEPQLVPVNAPPTAFRSQLPGTWNGGIRTLDGFPLGQPMTLQVRVWDIAVGSTWEEAVANGFGITQYGESQMFAYLHDPNDTTPWLGQMDNFRGFSLVPEPSVVALSVIVGGLLGFLVKQRVIKPSSGRHF